MPDSSLSGWQRLSEYWVAGETTSDLKSVDQIMDAVSCLGLDNAQVERVRDAIVSAITGTNKQEGLARQDSAMLIRLWIPDVAAEDDPPSWLDDKYDRWKESGGLGFFLIEKVVGDQENPWKVYCRMVDVLIYRKR